LNSKQRCLAAIHGEPLDRTPVFPLLMFLAADRSQMPYRRYATEGQVLAEAQLKVRQEYGVDAITSCSDAFRVSADLGGEMAYPEDRTPYLLKPLVSSQEDLNHLRKPDFSQPHSRMQDRVEATRAMVKAAGEDCLVLGWVDMPFAEACSVCGVSEFMLMIIEQPELAHQLLEFLTEIVIGFALAQVEAGAPMIGAGDAAASLISARSFRQFALPYEQQVCQAVHATGGLVKLHICGKTTHLLADMVQSGADLFNVDHLVDLATARKVYEAAGKCFKGNLDPVGDMLQASAQECTRAALRCLRLAQGSRYMLSAGCEVPAAVTDEVFRAFCQAPQKI
jgi:MtaA/CmuA family methyltransferase